MRLYTIGFTGKSAREFFTILKHSDVKKVIDVRLWPNTQLSGFSKSEDLAFFLKVLCHIDYENRKEFAPTATLLRDYKDGRLSWNDYVTQYDSICHARRFTLTPDMDKCCFLCAEPTPEKCHRRLLVEYLAKQDKNVEIIHL